MWKTFDVELVPVKVIAPDVFVAELPVNVAVPVLAALVREFDRLVR